MRERNVEAVEVRHRQPPWLDRSSAFRCDGIAATRVSRVRLDVASSDPLLGTWHGADENGERRPDERAPGTDQHKPEHATARRR